MTAYVALLRSVNVGGRVVPSAQLRGVFEELGYDDVTTYIQSGNVIFRSAGAAASVTTAAQGALTARFGHEIAVVLRSSAQLRRVLARNPLAERDAASLHVTFLQARPTSALARALDPEEHLPDEFSLSTTEVFVHCPNGYGRTKLNNAFFERRLKVPATTRNLRTVTTLADMAS